MSLRTVAAETPRPAAWVTVCDPTGWARVDVLLDDRAEDAGLAFVELRS